MKKNHYRFLLIFSLLLCAFTVADTTGTKPSVYVIGDSTACIYGTDRYPRTGWAQVLQPFFNTDSIVVSNQAASGRSSKSFYDEGRWTTVYNSLKAGDYVFIQFAHNDEKTEEDRHTDPETTFKYYLNIFISGAREKGAYPVLLSSIPRNNWSGSTIQQAHEPYTVAMKEVADSANVPFIDMEAITMAYLNSKGKSYATDSVYNNLPAGVYSTYPNGNSDGTHLQEKGAYELCKIMVADLKKTTGFPEMEKLAEAIVPVVRISAMPEPDLKGKITGSGVFTTNTTVSLKAVAASGYQFSKWTYAGDTTRYSTNSTINILTDSVDFTFVAHFVSSVGNTPIGLGNVKVYPNPANDFLKIETDADNWSVEIVDESGQMILSEKDSRTIEIGSLLPGSYIVAVKTKKQTTTRKIVVGL